MLTALAWDDNPEEYFEDLRTHLYEHGIEMEVRRDYRDIPGLLDRRRWDLVVLDVLDESFVAEAEDEKRGLKIWHWAYEKGLPVYFVTSKPEIPRDSQIPIDIPIISKLTPASFAAFDIKRDLIRKGRWINRKKVFLIYGHDRESNDASKKVRGLLKSWGLEVGTISGPDLSHGIVVDLLKQMRESVAVIAVCTPDDVVDNKVEKDSNGKKKYGQPRQNVLLEIGMAMGLGGGIHKLTFLQKTDSKDLKLSARLPTDLGGGDFLSLSQ